MKRWVKNLICFGGIGLALIAVFATMYFGKASAAEESMQDMQAGQAIEQPQQQGADASGGGTPPEMPSGEAQQGGSQQGGQSGGTPPAKPEGESNSSQGKQAQNGGTPPEMPSGEAQQGGSSQGSSTGGTPPEMSQSSGAEMGDMGEAGWTKLFIYSIYGLIIALLISYLIISRCNKLAFKESFKETNAKLAFIFATLLIMIVSACGFTYISIEIDGMASPGMNSASSVEYKAVTTYESNINLSNETYNSTETDTLAVMVMNKINAVLKDFTLTKTGSSDGGDNTSFYGMNSGIIAKDGASLEIDGADISTDANGANGIFSFGGTVMSGYQADSGDGTNVTVHDTKITTKQDQSGGIMTTGGGIMNAFNLLIETFGRSSAAIRSDRGGGTVNVDGGTYTTNGVGSPAIYSTAAIKVINSLLQSNTSEGVVIEGKNSVDLENCTLKDNNTTLNGQSTTYKNIFLYQSMSGDSAEGKAIFTAKNCDIETTKGDAIYVTNTEAEVNLENCNFTNSDNSGNILRIQKDSWGSEGKNGGSVTLNMKNQKSIGNIVVDAISSLVMNLTEGSYWEGALNSENLSQNVSLKLDASSKIKLNGDCYVSSFENADTNNSNIDFNGHKIYVNGTAI